jgi:hypothetical protein
VVSLRPGLHSPAVTVGSQSCRKQWCSMKLLIHCLARVGIPLDRKRASRLILLTPLKTPLGSKAMSVITFDRSHARRTVFVSTSIACSVFRPSRPPNCVSGSRRCVSAQYKSRLASTASSIFPSVFSSEFGRYAPGTV